MNVTIDALADIALYSEGAVTYTELKNMTSLEVGRIQQRMSEYYKAKAIAMGNAENLL